MDKKANLLGGLLAILLFVSLGALFFAKPSSTGFVVEEAQMQRATEPDYVPQSCFGNVAHGSCIETKPLYCNDGVFVYNCFACGCNKGEQCSQYGVCEPVEECVDGSLIGECSTILNGKFCEEGSLIDFCELCGCDDGSTCQNNKCVATS